MRNPVLLAVILAGGLLVQTAAPPALMADDAHMTVDEKMAKLTDELELTPEQQASIRPLVEEKKARLRAAPAEDADDIKDEYSGKIRDLLTEEQRVKYDAMKQKKSEKEQQRTPTETR